jgi:hypothetical protein
MDFSTPAPLPEKYVRMIDVIMKITAAPMVTLLKNGVAPVLPKTV